MRNIILFYSACLHNNNKEPHTPLDISFGSIQHHDDDICCPGNSNDLPTSTLTYKKKSRSQYHDDLRARCLL